MDASINFRVPQEIKDRIERLAAPRLLSVADMAREAILEKLARDEKAAKQDQIDQEACAS